MLADWYMKERIREAKEQGFLIGFTKGFAESCAKAYAKDCPEKYDEGYAIGRLLVTEAEKQRRIDETLEQSLDRLLAEIGRVRREKPPDFPKDPLGLRN